MKQKQEGLHPGEVLSKYGEVLELIKRGKGARALNILPWALPESMLPYSVGVIRHAMGIYLLHEDYIGEREIIEEAYRFLDNFIPDEEYDKYRFVRDMMSRRGRISYVSEGDRESMSDILRELRVRSKKMKQSRKRTKQELKSLRRIIGVPEDMALLEGEERDKEKRIEERVPELHLQYQ